MPDPKHFAARADSIPALAAEQAQTASIGNVSASLRHAAARINAHNETVQTGSAEAMKEHRATAVGYFIEQYKASLIEHLDDIIVDFDQHLGGE